MIDQLPCYYSVNGFELTLAFVRHSNKNILRPWFACGLPILAKVQANDSWDLVTDDRNIKHRGWQLWLWHKTVDLVGLEQFVTALREGLIRTDSRLFELKLQERSPVLLPAGHPLAPRQDESAWVHEFWDVSQEVVGLGDAPWRAFINSEVHRRLGLDLSAYSDRVGNVALFLPSGVKTQSRVEGETLYLRTNLRPIQLAGFEVEIETWSGEELAQRRRQPVDSPTPTFSDLGPFDKLRTTLWFEGEIVHQTQAHTFLRGASIDPSLVIGQRDGVTYTHSEGPTFVGDRSEAPWLRQQRDRRVAVQRDELAKHLHFKFYDPNLGESPDRALAEAREDLRTLLKRASVNLRIWDPYFGSAADDVAEDATFEDLDLIKQVKNLSAEIQLLISADDWTKSKGSPTLDKLAQHLTQQKAAFAARFSGVSCKAWVKREDTAFHDRFIIIDRRDVFLLGSSANGLGKKHSTLLKVDQAEAVVSAFDHIWDGRDLSWGQLIEVFRGS